MLRTVSGIVLQILGFAGISINSESNIIRILSDVIMVENPFNHLWCNFLVDDFPC